MGEASERLDEARPLKMKLKYRAQETLKADDDLCSKQTTAGSRDGQVEKTRPRILIFAQLILPLLADSGEPNTGRREWIRRA